MAQKTINPTLFGGMSGEFADASPRTTMKIWCNSQRSDHTLIFGDMLAYSGMTGAATWISEYDEESYEGETKLCFLVNPKENVLKSGIVNRGNETATPFAEVSEGYYSVATMGHIWIPAVVIHDSDEKPDECSSTYVYWDANSKICFTDIENEGVTDKNRISGVRLRRCIVLEKMDISADESQSTVLAEVEVCDPVITVKSAQ